MKNAAVAILFLASALGQCPAGRAPTNVNPASQDNAKATLALPRKDNSVRFAVIGDTGRGRREQFEIGGQMAAVPRGVPLRLRHHAGGQHLRRRQRGGHEAEVRGPLQGAPRQGREVLRQPGQPRQPESALLQALQHGRAALLLLQGAEGPGQGRGQRAVLRHRQQLPRQGTTAMARKGAGRVRGSDWKIPYFPPPPVFIGKDPRLIPRNAGGPRAALRRARRERGVRRPRPLL